MSEINSVISTPDRRRKSRVCHINMLKFYVGKSETEVTSSKDVEAFKPAGVLPAALCSSVDDPEMWELTQEHFKIPQC